MKWNIDIKINTWRCFILFLVRLLTWSLLKNAILSLWNIHHWFFFPVCRTVSFQESFRLQNDRIFYSLTRNHRPFFYYLHCCFSRPAEILKNLKKKMCLLSQVNKVKPLYFLEILALIKSNLNKFLKGNFHGICCQSLWVLVVVLLHL